jgi:hypothetical protein
MASIRLVVAQYRSCPFASFALLLPAAALASAGCSGKHSVMATTSRGQSDASFEGGNARVGLPTLTGPVTGGSQGKPFTAALIDLSTYGYIEEEYFLEGDATAYDWLNQPGEDGVWSVTATTTAHYKTRILVRRPTDPARFNGTVVVEWLNVSGGIDADPDFVFGHVELLRSGFAYVGVSAQAQGVMGGGFSLTASATPLVQWDPQRYGSLQHPGDDYSYDIFTQAARALREPDGPNPLYTLKPARLIADGESQSAFRMVTYVDAIQPISHAFDGFFIHSRGAGGTPLTVAAGAGVAGLFGGPTPARMRGDLASPVFQFETETDVLGLSGASTAFAAARQPDSAQLRTWEVAGTAHADLYLLTAEAAAATDAGAPGDAGAAGTLGCTDINSGPQHWVEAAALHSLQTWMTGGPSPATGDPLTLADAGAALALDSLGNALGGIRTAAVDVPIAAYSGKGDPSNVICSLFGKTTPFSPMQLANLYPTHDDYVTKVTAATMKAQQNGFILSTDVPAIVQEAQAAAVPGP